jgi:DNA-directed RNA polymerase subunit RPC12/RpoP
MTTEMWNFDVRCPTCGYNLRGLPIVNRCPDCGRPAVTRQLDDEALRIERLDAEIAERLQLDAEAVAQQQRIETLIAAWEERGRRFDKLMELAEARLREMKTGE